MLSVLYMLFYVRYDQKSHKNEKKPSYPICQNLRERLHSYEIGEKRKFAKFQNPKFKI